MMRGTRDRVVVILLALTLLSWTSAHTAPRPAGQEFKSYVVLVEIIEDPDPIPQGTDPLQVPKVSYVPLPTGSGSDVLAGLVFDPDEMWPLAVAAYLDGTRPAVEFGVWTGARWEAVPVSAEAEPRGAREPRGFAGGDGTLHVVWWIPGAIDSVKYAGGLSHGATWTAREPVTRPGEAGRRPTVAAFQGLVFAAYERPATGALEVVVAVRDIGGAWRSELVTTTRRTERIDTLLHVEGGRMWLDWRHSDAEVGWSQLVDGVWGAPAALPIGGDADDEDVEAARELVRQTVLGSR
jgi:hypothetical protein